MSADKKEWSPDHEQALKALIKQTIDSVGPLAPDAIPHRVKEIIRGQATGDLDVDAYIREILRQTKNKN